MHYKIQSIDYKDECTLYSLAPSDSVHDESSSFCAYFSPHIWPIG